MCAYMRWFDKRCELNQNKEKFITQRANTSQTQHRYQEKHTNFLLTTFLHRDFYSKLASICVNLSLSCLQTNSFGEPKHKSKCVAVRTKFPLAKNQPKVLNLRLFEVINSSYRFNKINLNKIYLLK